MNYLLYRDRRYYYNRRVPDTYREFDTRRVIRVALKTDNKREAIKRAIIQNEETERYWQSLIDTGRKYNNCEYEQIVKRARMLGFTYLANSELAAAPFDMIYERLKHVEKHMFNKVHVQAVIGAKEKPVIRLNDALKRFWDYSKDKTYNKSPNQLRKWTTPRKRAMKNFVDCVGNKPLTDITRDDMLRFRDWWINRIQNEDLVANSANKNFIQLKTIIETVNDNLELDMDIPRLFRKLLLNEDDERRRLPFPTEFLREKLLRHENFTELNEQAKWVLFAFAETGAGFSELLGLLPEDIILDADIPHISITPRSKKLLKTKYRKRTIPLVGFALDAFKAYPRGFTDYHDKPDGLSHVISKYLIDRSLLPTENHSIYSLRHSFQDRLLAVNAPDRVQADLMGHKFGRQAYGDGASLEQKMEWLGKITIK